MKILFVTPECAPYVKTGGLGDVSAALPATLASLGHDVRILMPAYSGMQVAGEVGPAIAIPAKQSWPGAQLLPIGLDNGVTLLTLTCNDYYQRSGGPYVDQLGHDYADNAMRFGFLSRVAAAIGTAHTPCPGWQADVVHANDWPCGLAPLYLAQARALDIGHPTAASVITIHNIAFQGIFPMATADALGIPAQWRGIDGVEFWNQLSMLKAGLQFADAITTVSPTYAQEIQTEAFGVGLDGVLRARSSNLVGILNGIDTRLWDPATDPALPHRYSTTDLSGKALDKVALQRRCGLEADAGAMLFGVVSRLTAQKGIDLVLAVLPSLLEQGAQLVVLGVGEPALQDALTRAAHDHPSQVSVRLGFDETFAHQVEAGIDAFLMPSRFEPCGLNQMYSQAYGTPPVVAATGGLVDSVTDASADPVQGTGFIMATPDAKGLNDACRRAMDAWHQRDVWKRIQLNGMACSFAWERSAQQYVEVYASAIARVH